MAIRETDPKDTGKIRELLMAAFKGNLEADLVEELRRSSKVILESVAEKEGHIVGHILFSAVRIKESNTNNTVGVGLAPLAVMPQHQRTGIGSLLINHSLPILKKRGFPFAAVLGDPSYYSRFGFRASTQWDIKCEFDAPEEAFQLLPLTVKPLPPGTAQYEPEFDRFKT